MSRWCRLTAPRRGLCTQKVEDGLGVRLLGVFGGVGGVGELHPVAAGHRGEGAEGGAEEGPELLLAGEPDDLALLDAVQGPLGGAVESDHLAALIVAHFDGHIADHEHVFVHVPVRHHETVPRRGCPQHSGPAQSSGLLDRDHPSIICPPRAILDAGDAEGDLRRDVSTEDIRAGLLGIFTVAGRPGPSTSTALSPTSAGTIQGARGELVRLPSNGVAIVEFSHLPPAPAGHVYQLWVGPTTSQVQSVGVFLPDQDGSKVILIDQNLAHDHLIAVTLEPAPDGSAAPTQAPGLLGRF